LLVFWFVCIEVQESEKVLEASSFKRATWIQAYKTTRDSSIMAMILQKVTNSSIHIWFSYFPITTNYVLQTLLSEQRAACFRISKFLQPAFIRSLAETSSKILPLRYQNSLQRCFSFFPAAKSRFHASHSLTSTFLYLNFDSIALGFS
jgi:hypothetical protein